MTADVDSAEQSGTGMGSIRQLSIAPNGQFVAAYTADGRLKVWTSDFTKALSEFATQSEKVPERVEWCGADSVVMCWQVSWKDNIFAASQINVHTFGLLVQLILVRLHLESHICCRAQQSGLLNFTCGVAC